MSSGSLVLSDETPPPLIVPESMTLPDLLAAAKPDPAAIALLSRDGVLTHGEFDAGSNRLARHLIARGIGPVSLVAIAVPGGAGLVIAVAAVLKAGGGCLLLDPRDASGRQNKVLEDSGAALVLKEIADETVLGGFDPGPVRDEERLAPLQPDNLAFLFYTSGSTGKPKGVALTHANFTNKLRDQMRLWDVGASSRFAFSSSLNFDPAVHQMLLPLAAGGSCVIISPEELADPDLFLGALANASATHLDIVPSVAAVLADRPGFPALEVLILGGEVLPPSLANRVRKRLRHGRLFNMYGPTEACVDATGFEVVCDMEGPVPLGRALGGYGVHILDESRRLLPRGALGEIYIAGAGLARGYWKNAGLTAERFLPCPFAAQGGLMYRTGDRGFFDAQDNLVFAGRADDQIKIRGVRIEPGEIEAALMELAGVGQAAVIPAGERLIAYVTASTGISPDVDVLRAALMQKLPAVMVPSAITVLDVMPLSPNGKLDRKSLPDAGPGESPIYVAPASDLEARICALFGALTDTGRVSATDNFFALGGHSLLVMRLLSRLRGECGHDVPVEAVFAHPTPRALAGAIAAGPAPSCRPLVPLREGGSSAPLFCVHPAGGLAAIYTRMLSGIDAAIPVFGLQARGSYDETPPHASIPDMACAYADEICRSAPGPVYLAGWSFGGAAAHEIAALLEERGRAVTGLFLIDTYFSSVADDDVDKAASVMEADGTFFTRIESAVRRSATLLDDHRPRRIHAPVVFLRARDNRDEELVSRLERLTRGPIAIEEMDAGHYALFEQDYAPAVGSVLNRYMTEDVPLLGQAV
jgi:amino acid adenylation domain-containing protein